MSKHEISWIGIGLRFLGALVLVLATYNPEGYSFSHWIVSPQGGSLPLKLFFGIVLLIGWTIYLRATINSLGGFGMAMVVALFAAALWLMVSWGWLSAGTYRAVAYMILFIIICLLTAGISWSHLRRRLSGQVDVDELDER